MLASTFRPDSWNLPLLVHVLGAMLLVGALLVASTAILVARGEVRVMRLGYWTLLAVALPAYFVMRTGAEWLYSREELDQAPSDPAWVGIGYITADAGGLLLLVALILGGIGIRRAGAGKGTGLLRSSLVISVILLAAYVVTIWAMGAKPS